MKKILLLTILISTVSWADCSNIDSSTDKRECYQKRLNIADKKLLSTYQENLKTTSAESKQQLIKAQRLWVQFKEADCLYDASRIDDRTGFTSNQLACLIKKSTTREQELQDRLGDN